MTRYTAPSISGYNASPPPDDGTQTSDNEITWAKHKQKLADPVKTYADDINSAIGDAFDLLPFKGGTTKTANFNVAASNNGEIFLCTNVTASLPAAATAEDGFMVGFFNTHASGNLTISPDGSETINGSNSSLTISPGNSLILFCDGSKWVSFGLSGTLSTLLNIFVTSGAQLYLRSADNTNDVQQEHINLYRGNGTGKFFRLLSVGDGSNGFDELILQLRNPSGPVNANFSFRDNGTLGLPANGSANGDAARVGQINSAIAGNVIGIGQTPQDVSGSRAAATNYTNTTGKPIEVAITLADVTSEVRVGGVAVGSQQASGIGVRNTISFTVPPGSVYRLHSSVAFIHWTELR